MARFLFFSIQISDFEEDSCSYPNVLKTHINTQINTHFRNLHNIHNIYNLKTTFKLYFAPRGSQTVPFGGCVDNTLRGGTINIIFHVQLQASCIFSISETEKNRRKGKKNGERRREEK